MMEGRKARTGAGASSEAAEAEMRVEQAHLADIIARIQAHIERLGAASGNLRAAAERVSGDFWEDISLDESTSDDLLESYADIAQQAALVEELRARLGASEAEVAALVKMMQRPYFARIDFVPEGEEPLTLYIGLRAFYDETRGEELIVDWRAPIAALYYEHAVGPAAYRAPGGAVRGRLTKKRQFIIRGGKLKAMYDIDDVAAGDELLGEILSRPAEPHLRAVAETIQREQSAVIRDETHGVLIVEGAAGSGKTSVALMHIAYLLHRFRGTLLSRDVLILSPNALFQEYIGTVLPELGETNVRRTTLAERLRSVLDGASIETLFDKLEFLLGGDADDARRVFRRESDAWIGSPAFVRLLDQFIEALTPEMIAFVDLGDEDAVWFPAERIREAARRLASRDRHPEAWLVALKARLRGALAKRAEAMLRAPWVDQALDGVDPVLARKAYEAVLKDEGPLQELDRRYELRLRRTIVRRRAKALAERIAVWAFIDWTETYRRLFTEADGRTKALWERFRAETGLPSAAVRRFVAGVVERLRSTPLVYEDALALAYLRTRLVRDGEDASVRHVMVDEAQDYGPLELAWLLRLFPKARLMLLGDRAQALTPRPTVFDEAVVQSLMEHATPSRGPFGIRRLPASYRSTKEIQALAYRVLGEPMPEGSFLRSGPEPRLIVVPSYDRLAREIVGEIRRFKDAGFGMIAVLCKTERECETAEAYLAGRIGYQRVYPETREMKGKVLLMPAAMAKGIEFDAVIVFDVSGACYHEAYDRHLLYTLIMRAKHAVTLCSVGEPTPLIPREHVQVLTSSPD